MQYQASIHGTSARVETPETVERVNTVGWGTVVTFKPPTPQDVGLPIFADEHPGSWLHLTIPLTLPLPSAGHTRLESITLFGETIHCRIKNVHIWDGPYLLDPRNDVGIKGSFYEEGVTIPFPRRPLVDVAIGISLYACAFHQDYDRNGRTWDYAHEPRFPDAMMILSGARANIRLPDPPKAPDFAILFEDVANLGTVKRLEP
jgi:hypothetical protein